MVGSGLVAGWSDCVKRSPWKQENQPSSSEMRPIVSAAMPAPPLHVRAAAAGVEIRICLEAVVHADDI
jgi:hypothetical protein